MKFKVAHDAVLVYLCRCFGVWLCGQRKVKKLEVRFSCHCLTSPQEGGSIMMMMPSAFRSAERMQRRKPKHAHMGRLPKSTFVLSEDEMLCSARKLQLCGNPSTAECTCGPSELDTQTELFQSSKIKLFSAVKQQIKHKVHNLEFPNICHLGLFDHLLFYICTHICTVTHHRE